MAKRASSPPPRVPGSLSKAGLRRLNLHSQTISLRFETRLGTFSRLPPHAMTRPTFSHISWSRVAKYMQNGVYRCPTAQISTLITLQAYSPSFCFCAGLHSGFKPPKAAADRSINCVYEDDFCQLLQVQSAFSTKFGINQSHEPFHIEGFEQASFKPSILERTKTWSDRSQAGHHDHRKRGIVASRVKTVHSHPYQAWQCP